MRNHCCQILWLFKRTWKPRFVMWHFPTFKSRYWPKKIQVGLNIAHNNQFVILIRTWNADLFVNILVQLVGALSSHGSVHLLWCWWVPFLATMYPCLFFVIFCSPENSPDLLLYVRWVRCPHKSLRVLLFQTPLASFSLPFPLSLCDSDFPEFCCKNSFAFSPFHPLSWTPGKNWLVV